IEEYRTDDAEVILILLGSHTGTARVVVDAKREEGIKVGLIKIRVFRPFPRERLLEALQGKQYIGVFDRSVALGGVGGHIFNEIQAVLSGLNHDVKALNFIGGLGGADVTKPLIARAIDQIWRASKGEACQEVTWLNLE
ncbi:MAG: pyruvate synthase subunit PorA, partial [Desulfobacterales bacterium]|nr:pyruvate synthase subunit PorA [Desulfobacterales bacterium]